MDDREARPHARLHSDPFDTRDFDDATRFAIMRMTVLGGGGAWPTPERGCSGYLIEEAGFGLLIDPGYATMPRLLDIVPAHGVDAVVVSHGHPDHCADLNPLLRARHLSDDPPPPLPVFALGGALDAVLALDGPMFAEGEDYVIHELAGGDRLEIGPFQLVTRWLRHFLPNVGLRLDVGGTAMAYTGDGGADPDIVALAAGVGLLLAEATFPEHVPEEFEGLLGSACQAGEYASAARAGRLVLTHLWPGTDPDAAVGAASRSFDGPISVARPGLRAEIA